MTANWSKLLLSAALMWSVMARQHKPLFLSKFIASSTCWLSTHNVAATYNTKEVTWSDLKPKKLWRQSKKTCKQSLTTMEAALMTTINRMRQVVVIVLYRYRSGCRATAAYNSNNYKQATQVTIIVIKSPIDEQSYRHRFQTIGLWDLLRINGWLVHWGNDWSSVAACYVSV